MMDSTHALSISRQAQLAGLSRGSVYSVPTSVSAADLALMRRLDAWHVEHPFMGARMLRDQLNRKGGTVGRTHVGTRMARRGHGGALPAAWHQHEAPRARNRSLPAARAHHQPGEPGVGTGYDRHPDGPRVRLPRGRCGLGQPQGTG